MPQAMPALIWPAPIMALTRWVACWADEHCASISVEAVAFGRPACIQARRTMLFDCSPTWVTQPPIDLLDQVGLDAGAGDHLGLRHAQEHRGMEAGQHAIPLALGVRTASTITGVPMVQN